MFSPADCDRSCMETSDVSSALRKCLHIWHKHLLGVESELNENTMSDITEQFASMTKKQLVKYH